MAKGNNENNSGENRFLAGYGWQVTVVPLAAIVLLSIFIWLFGFDTNLLLINIVALAGWSAFIVWAFKRRPNGEFWRNYRWIIGSAVLILLVLIDFSWAKSTLSVNTLGKRELVEYSIPGSSTKLHVEYPIQILYDSQNMPSLILWLTNADSSQAVTVTGKDLLFAIQTSSESPLQWKEAINVPLTNDGSELTVLLQPMSNPKTTEESKIIVTSNDVELKPDQSVSPPSIKLEGKQNVQNRMWRAALLDAGDIIISLIIAIFAGIKQLENEKRRQRVSDISQAIDNFYADMKSDFSKALEKCLELVGDWNAWEKTLQDRFIQKVTEFLDSENFWESLVNKDVSELDDDIKRLLRICETIGIASEQLNLLSSSLPQDTSRVQALLTLLKNYPQSILTVKKIASALPSELRRKIPDEYKNEFPKQIDVLGFLNSESYPLQNQFAYYTKDYISDDKLTLWLQAHQLDYSPFADADNPFYSLLDKKILIDLATPGFTFPMPDFRNTIFRFANSWDVGAALFNYCKGLQPSLRIKEEAFFAVVTPSMVEDYDADYPQKLLLHALAEQWIWSLAETPTLFYSLKDAQRDLLGRFLRWHDISPAITTSKIAERMQGKRVEKSAYTLLLKIKEWLDRASSTELRVEESNALIELRPSLKRHTFFLVPTADLNPHVERQDSPEVHEKLDEELAWLNAHDCVLVHFLIDDQKRQSVSQSSLVTQCNIRIQKCSRDIIAAFDLLFVPHENEPAENILAKKANGSPGEMVRLGQKLLLQHIAKYPREEDLHIEDLIAL